MVRLSKDVRFIRKRLKERDCLEGLKNWTLKTGWEGV